jgi:hypothetical protein
MYIAISSHALSQAFRSHDHQLVAAVGVCYASADLAEMYYLALSICTLTYEALMESMRPVLLLNTMALMYSAYAATVGSFIAN